MIEVSIMLPSFVFRMSSYATGKWIESTRELGGTATVADVLADLVATHPGFRDAVYDPECGAVNDEIGVVLNGELLTFDEISGKKLSDGDIVQVQPAYSGGEKQ